MSLWDGIRGIYIANLTRPFLFFLFFKQTKQFSLCRTQEWTTHTSIQVVANLFWPRFNFLFLYRLSSLRASIQSTGTGNTSLNVEGQVCTPEHQRITCDLPLSCRITLIPLLKVFPTHRGGAGSPRWERETRGTPWSSVMPGLLKPLEPVPPLKQGQGGWLP